MDGADWLRTQLTSFGCATCGRAYESERIRILAQRDALFFVDLSCTMCGSQATAVVTVQSEGAHDMDGQVGGVDASVTTDDVESMHDFLAGFDGDVSGMFRAASQDA